MIEVSAGVLTAPDGRVLLVRKAHTVAFMNPGGKPEPGETPAVTLCRELEEELQLTTVIGDLTWLGQITTDAANEPGRRLRAQCFGLQLSSPGHRIGAEIAESAWFDPNRPDALNLAPLARILLLSDHGVSGAVVDQACGDPAR